MHTSVMDWVAMKVQQYGLAAPGNHVLEVGSRNVNGTVRPIFTGAQQYVGVEMTEGPDVDVILDAHELTSRFGKESFDVVVSTEMLEHDSQFWTSLSMMGEVLKAGGFLLITARGNGFWIHDYPADYFRFLPESFRVLPNLAACEVLEIRQDWHLGHPSVFGVGRKRVQ